jgi:hypothetical protein
VIGVEARGRLGNRMFQFAFGLAAAGALGTDFAMNLDLLRQSFRLDPYLDPSHRARRALQYRRRRASAPHPVVKVEDDADPAAVIDTLSDETHYVGFFQSERYFDGAAGAVERAFAPRRRYLDAFRRRYADLVGRPYVCCHVRRGPDYVGLRYAVPLSYYDDCLDQFEPGPTTPVVFVGDELAEARARFAHRPGVRFEQNPEPIDLLLLANASAVAVSNSSFAWWGGWLAGRHGARVLAPRHWLGVREGREIPSQVVPRWWCQVPVRPEADDPPG